MEYCSEGVYGIQFVGIASYLCFIYIKPHSCTCSCDIGCDKKIAPFSQIHQNVVHSKRFLFKVCLYIFSLVQGASFPTPTGITQEMARNNCTSFISLSAAGNACQAIVEVDVQGTLESCIDDIMVSHN